MYKHIVFWKIKEPSRAREFALGAQEKLEQMRRNIDGLLHIELFADESATDMSADLALYSEFSSKAAYKAYDAHPLHLEFKAYLGPHRTERRVVDYETNQQE